MATSYYDSKMFYAYLDGDKAWELIERKAMGHNVSLDTLYPEHFITEVTSATNSENLKPMLLPDEQYYLFVGDCDNYAITSFGRVFNAKYQTQSKVYIAKDRITTNIRTTKIYFATEFMKMGWSFSIDEIKRRYDDNKWSYTYKGITHNQNENRSNI